MRLKANKTRNHITNTEDIEQVFLLECMSRNLSEFTIRTYRVNIQYLMEYLKTNDINFTDISSKTINDYKLHLMENTDRNTTSINTNLRHINTYLKWCYESEYITQQIKVKYSKVKQEPKDTYTDDDIKTLLRKPKISECTYTEYRTYVIINVLVSTGIRRSSLLNIKLDDILWSKQLIKLSHTKNKQIHYVSMNSKLISVLKEWLKYRVDNSDYLFTTQTGKKLEPLTVSTSISIYNKSKGVDVTSCHAFRHYYSTKLVQSGVDIFTISKLLGHSNIAITQNYLRSLNQEEYIKKNSIDIYSLLE